MYMKFGRHPHPQASSVPNLVSFAASIAELAHGEKSHTAYLMPRERKLALRNKMTGGF